MKQIFAPTMIVYELWRRTKLNFSLTKQKKDDVRIHSEYHLCKGEKLEITFLLNKENWTEQPWQWDASTTQAAPRMDGFGGNPIFSNIAARVNKLSSPCNHEEPTKVNVIFKYTDFIYHGKEK